MEAKKDTGVSLRLLSLDGGGVRGLSSLMILKDIMRGLNRGRSPENIQQPWQVFDLIGGTSTGGLLAVMLGRLRMSVEECEATYLKLSERIFNPRRFSANVIGRAKDAWKVEGRFDAEVLKACIIELLEERKVDKEALLKDPESRCKVFVCAVLTSNSRACVLRSYENEEMSELLYDSCKIWEACRATSAATTFFDPIEIGPYNQKFADGAVAYNNPIQLVYREAETLWPQKIREATLISIGTGSAPSPALEGNILNVVNVLKDIVVQTETTADDFFSDHLRMVNKDLLYRFNVYHGLAEVGLEEFKERNRIADATHAYLTAGETRQRWRKCVQKLGPGVEAEISSPIANVSSPRMSMRSLPRSLPPQQATTFTRPHVHLFPPSTNAPTLSLEARTQLDNRLLSSITECREAQLQEALAEGADIQAQDNKPLILAIENGATNIVQLLLGEGANVNAPDGKGLYPITLAVRKSDFLLTKILTEYGADINIPEKRGISYTSLHLAVHKDKDVIVEYLLQHGADIEALTDPDLRSPLHIAAECGNFEAIEMLLDAGSNIEAKDFESRTPLHFACGTKPEHYESVKLLIERGANPEAKLSRKSQFLYHDPDGGTVLHSAVRRDLGEIVELLVKNGADVYAKNKNKQTALDLAVHLKRKKVIAALPRDSRSADTKSLMEGVGDIMYDVSTAVGSLFYR